MKAKTSAIIWMIATVIIAIVGFSGYASGDRYMEWFGIRLSETGFLILILVFVIIDILSIAGAVKQEKNQQKTQSENLNSFASRTDLEQLPIPCTVSITRGSSFAGAAVACTVLLNYSEVGILKNGKTITFTTSIKQNVLTLNYSSGQTSQPFTFDAVPGGNIQIDFKFNKAQLTLRQQQYINQ